MVTLDPKFSPNTRWWHRRSRTFSQATTQPRTFDDDEGEDDEDDEDDGNDGDDDEDYPDMTRNTMTIKEESEGDEYDEDEAGAIAEKRQRR